ncbi:MAG: hypothetical protein AAB691_04140 [Patescibacteria group bacterium]
MNSKMHIAKEGGYITLVSVLVVGAVTVGVATSLIWLGLGSSRSSFAYQQSATARAMAHLCIEEGLQQIRDVTSFTGNGTSTQSEGSCEYSVTNDGGQSRTVMATGTVGTIVRRARVSVSAITPLITISSWQEVAD